mmetsp:Transcript_8971/g.21898  ORF Transcript_8971/g.21898 Transcript_8971/m.21898 type:complete len:535 (+) Transcript_8971:87-1691(+)
MFRSRYPRKEEEEQMKYTSNKGDNLLHPGNKGSGSKFGINVHLKSQNATSRPPNTITYVSPPSSPRATREHFIERTDADERAHEPTSAYASMDNQRDDISYSYKDISDNSLAHLKKLDPAHPMIAGHSQASTSRSQTQALNLKHNDDAFHIVAKLLVDRFEEQLSDKNTKSIRVKAGDMYHIERVVPDKAAFIDAVQFRVKNCPENSTKSIHELTRRCEALGLHRSEKKNLLYAPIGSIYYISETKEPIKITKVNMEAIRSAKPNTLDDLAKQQITTELEEAQNLMEESVTAEAKEFWRKQVIEFEAKLRALEGGKTEPIKKDMNYLKTEQGLLSTLWKTVGYAPPVIETEEPTTVENQQKGIELTTSSASSQVVSPTISQNALPSGRSTDGIEELPIVDVVAPSDLPGGYKFEAELNGKRFMATVPNGGVQKGKTFYCYMEPTDDAKILVGAWKDSPLDLFKFGYKHPMVLNSLLCPLLALSQIMERVGLDLTGKKSGKRYTATRAVHPSWYGTEHVICLGWFECYDSLWSRD